MRAMLAAGFAFMLMGCAGPVGQPVELTVPAPAPVNETTACINEELEDMAYEITSNAQSGVIQALRVNEQPWWLKLIGYRDHVDQITATITNDQLRVIATSSDPTATAAATTGASEAAERDARRIVNECTRRT